MGGFLFAEIKVDHLLPLGTVLKKTLFYFTNLPAFKRLFLHIFSLIIAPSIAEKSQFKLDFKPDNLFQFYSLKFSNLVC